MTYDSNMLMSKIWSWLNICLNSWSKMISCQFTPTRTTRRCLLTHLWPWRWVLRRESLVLMRVWAWGQRKAPAKLVAQAVLKETVFLKGHRKFQPLVALHLTGLPMCWIYTRKLEMRSNSRLARDLRLQWSTLIATLMWVPRLSKVLLRTQIWWRWPNILIKKCYLESLTLDLFSQSTTAN